jgi:hypothetical protein
MKPIDLALADGVGSRGTDGGLKHIASPSLTLVSRTFSRAPFGIFSRCFSSEGADRLTRSTSDIVLRLILMSCLWIPHPNAAGNPIARRSPSTLTIKRPKPGSIWSGPKEAWCAFPVSPEPEQDRPGDLDGNPAPEPLPPPVPLLPLLFLLKSLPTLEEVASYFTGALGQPPVREGEAGAPEKLRFERWLFFSWGNSWRRCVLSEGTRDGPGVTLEWWTNDDFGLSELREFFEAPFFRQCESEQFYQWLGEEGVHEAGFRGHRLRMAVQLREEVLFVRIQWWRPTPEGIASQGMLNEKLTSQNGAWTSPARDWLKDQLRDTLFTPPGGSVPTPISTAGPAPRRVLRGEPAFRIHPTKAPFGGSRLKQKLQRIEDDKPVRTGVANHDAGLNVII